MATPSATDYIISQGDSLPVMRIVIPANSDGQQLDLTGCTVKFLGRPVGSRTTPPPIALPIQSYATETEGDDTVTAVYVKFTTAVTKAVVVPEDEIYQQMQGELEVTDDSGDVLTVPSAGYLTWWIRDDIGEVS